MTNLEEFKSAREAVLAAYNTAADKAIEWTSLADELGEAVRRLGIINPTPPIVLATLIPNRDGAVPTGRRRATGMVSD